MDDYVELESESNRLNSSYPSCAYPHEVVLQLELDSQIGESHTLAPMCGGVKTC